MSDVRVSDVRIDDNALNVTLCDGRKISLPLEWFPRLQQAPREDSAVWEPSAAGNGIHWPLIDEDLSVEGLLHTASALDT